MLEYREALELGDTRWYTLPNREVTTKNCYHECLSEADFLTLNNKDMDSVMKYFLGSEEKLSEKVLKCELSDEDKEFEKMYQMEVVNPRRLMIMMRCEVKQGKPRGYTSGLLEAALEQRAGHREKMSPEEYEAVSLFVKWRDGGLLTERETVTINRYLNLGKGEQIMSDPVVVKQEKGNLQGEQFPLSTPQDQGMPGGVSLDIRESGEQLRLGLGNLVLGKWMAFRMSPSGGRRKRQSLSLRMEKVIWK